ncbi:MAG: hypothetical protein ABIN89_26025, partial [Chitinophagaceae bacterium]
MKVIIKFTDCILFIGIIVSTSCKRQLVDGNIQLPAANQPPVAKTGADQTILLPKDSILLDGSASTDPDGTITSNHWTKISGPLSYHILRPDSSKTIAKTLAIGVYKFELTIKDNGGISAKDTIQITVEKPASNQSPFADAGPDQTLTLPLDSAYLDGSASSPNGWSAALSKFVWSSISGPSQSSIGPVTSLPGAPGFIPVSVIAKKLVPGTYLFRLQITNSSGEDADTVQVDVVNDPLAKNTVTYHNLIWQVGDVYGLAELDNFLNTSLRSDIFYSYSSIKPLQVFLNFDTASSWISVPYKVGGLYYDGNGEYLWVINYPNY